MEHQNDKCRRSRCEGRTVRFSHSEGDDAVPFRYEIPYRDISMIVFCNGTAYQACASIQIEGEGTEEWMAAAIAVLVTSVDMALKRG